MPTWLVDGHLPDGEMIRLVDGEVDREERGAAEAHLAECAACGRRLRQLRARSLRLGSLLRESDWEVPPAAPPVSAAPAAQGGDELARLRARRGQAARPRAWMRAAAVALLLLGAGVAASPLRAWIVEWAGERWAALVGGAAESDAAPAAPSAALPAGSRVQFTPRGDALTVEFASRQEAGTLEVATGGSGQVVAEQVGGSEPAELLVLPSGVRVRNHPASTAGYRITVPPGIRRVLVRVGGGPPVVLAPERLADGARIPLDAR